MLAALLLAGEGVLAATGRGAGDMLTLAVLSVCTLRVYSLLRSVIWLWFKARAFGMVAKEADLRGVPSPETIYGLYAKTGGVFFPFGIRAIYLEYIKRTGSGARRRAARLLYRMWKYYVFTLLMATLELVLGLRFAGSLDAVARAFVFASGVLLLLGALFIAVEGILAYVNFSSWSVAYHRLDVRSGNAVSEFSAFAGGAITAYVAAASAIVFIARAYHSFAAPSANGPWWRVLGAGFYYALTGFTGNGDADPRDFPAFFATAILYLEGTTFLVVVISLLINSLGSDGVPEPPAAPEQRDPARRL
jgi:hypothetical protein